MKKVVTFLMVLCMVSPVFAQRAHQTPKKTPKDVEQNINESLRKKQQPQRVLIDAALNNNLLLVASSLNEYPELANMPLLVPAEYHEAEFSFSREVPLMCVLASSNRGQIIELFISKGLRSNFTCPAADIGPSPNGAEKSYKDSIYTVPLSTLVMIRWDVLKVLEVSKNAKVQQWLKKTGISDVSDLERSRKGIEVSIRRQFGKNQKLADWALSLKGDETLVFPEGAIIACDFWEGDPKWEEKRPFIFINDRSGYHGRAEGFYFYGYDKKLLRKLESRHYGDRCTITSRKNKKRGYEVRTRDSGC
ncbi:MAG: hypothetical protein J5601_02425 [Elusimicrobiaceae bacterium]|nr:hypothetical protein [Elusimicrobiaceae bacterium]